MISGRGLLEWLIAQVHSPRDPGFWLAGSIAVALVACSLAGLILRVSGKRVAAKITGWPGTSPLAWLLAALFFLLPPLAAWRLGALSPYYLGLSGLDWLGGLGAGGLVAALVIVLSLVGWAVYRGTLPAGWRPAEPWRTPLDAALWQWHSAFYRAAAAGWLATLSGTPSFINGAALQAGLSAGPGAILSPLITALATAYHALANPANSLYWGAWLGLALVALEWALNPLRQVELRTTGRAEQVVRGAALAATSTALFILTRNFWLCLACHVLVELAIANWGAAFGLRRQAE